MCDLHDYESCGIFVTRFAGSFVFQYQLHTAIDQTLELVLYMTMSDFAFMMLDT